MIKQPEIFKFICRCGRSIMAIGENTRCRCGCGKLMIRADSLHPLAIYRYSHKLTQAELADLLNIDRSLIAKIETKVAVISCNLKARIKKICNLDL